MRKNVLKPKKKPKKEPRTILQLTRKQFLVWAGITLFAMVWMFVLGILVGRDRSPVRFDVPKITEKMADLKDKMLPAEKAGPGTESEAVAEESDLEFYKALRDKHKEPKPQVTRAYEEPAEPKVTPVVPKTMIAEPEVVPEKPVAAEPQPEVVPKEAKTKPTEPETVPVKVAVTEKPIPQRVEKAIKKEEPKPEKKEQAGRYTVQVAAFKNVDRARELIVYLKKKGYDAYQATVHLPDKGTYHRVRIGHFTNKKEAVRLVSKLGKNYLDAVVVRE